ncbi:BamA/TamA family outer membrane protein [Vibrio sp. SCSIO 43135]|uniref:Outer membrane protein assembly factor n=1 Tax=Vibrio paucivorans TaxID=2829489 RepID=A0A9X3CCZ7_9VIBR|nr:MULTISPECIES: BamA/TamA family outer membrane protein [Vibrio]MCW8333375.1 outer membrane protein assembly factor [Vibrio paucivorans]USD41788.1 BamA/TamA family outer membrane protein [Vibrio sp. SCSIO 43135]
MLRNTTTIFGSLQWICSLLFCFSTASHAQEDPVLATTPAEKDNGLFSLLGGPAYMPETGFMLAIGGLYSFNAAPKDPDSTQRSSVTLVGVANEMDSGVGFGIRSKQKIFSKQNRFRYFGQLSMGKQSLYYFGTGYESGKNNGKDDQNLVDYDFITYNADLGAHLGNNIYLGPILRLQYKKAIEESVSSTVAQDADFIYGQENPFALGLGIALQWDTRDVAVNARKGQFFSLEYANYQDNIGSDSNFEKMEADYRFYWTPVKGSTFAFLNTANFSSGDVPYYELPTFGGQDSMRGIYYGRYRDMHSVEHTMEYRQSFLSDGDYTKHGFTLWAGIASTAEHTSELYQEQIYSYGVGYRYELQPRMNVRVDLGFGSNDAQGLYLSINEAF